MIQDSRGLPGETNMKIKIASLILAAEMFAVTAHADPNVFGTMPGGRVAHAVPSNAWAPGEQDAANALANAEQAYSNARKFATSAAVIQQAYDAMEAAGEALTALVPPGIDCRWGQGRPVWYRTGHGWSMSVPN